MAVSWADGQVVFDNDLAALLRAIEGTGVLSGWTTTAHSPANMSVDVALGVGYVGSAKKSTAITTNVVITAADATKARRDIIIWDTSEGELAAVDGTAEAVLPYGETDFKKMSHPAPPDIPATDDILIAQVYVAAGTSSIVTANIWDKRYFLPAGRLIVEDTEVFSSAAPTSWTDLDLSGTVGANTALVLLKLSSNTGGDDVAVRKNGDTDEFWNTNTTDARGCALFQSITGGCHVVVIVCTDTAGKIEWKSQAGDSYTVDVMAYIK